ncbi:hypothetical protein OSB04_020966 [Centaurea solstitialis]|uniref:Uncharacterized protein n=1 Tax=Centaurea solstitialis TaxID=347529 RepID=A0AA38TD03_9ASTR|nr:hypothetical protein OSB04_020966 [Centaurea solstitialis]
MLGGATIVATIAYFMCYMLTRSSVPPPLMLPKYIILPFLDLDLDQTSMDQKKKNALRLNGRRKVVVMGEGAAGCFMCVNRFESIKDLYGHIVRDHSDSEWKAFFASHKTKTTINVGGWNKDLLSGWKVTGKRGRPGSKVIDEELHELAECLLLLASGPPKIQDIDPRAGDHQCMVSKEVDQVESAAMEGSDFKRGRFMASTSKGEPRRLDDDFQVGRYFAVHDFDLNEDPTSTPPPMKDVEDRSM